MIATNNEGNVSYDSLPSTIASNDRIRPKYLSALSRTRPRRTLKVNRCIIRDLSKRTLQTRICEPGQTATILRNATSPCVKEGNGDVGWDRWDNSAKGHAVALKDVHAANIKPVKHFRAERFHHGKDELSLALRLSQHNQQSSIKKMKEIEQKEKDELEKVMRLSLHSNQIEYEREEKEKVELQKVLRLSLHSNLTRYDQNYDSSDDTIHSIYETDSDEEDLTIVADLFTNNSHSRIQTMKDEEDIEDDVSNNGNKDHGDQDEIKGLQMALRLSSVDVFEVEEGDIEDEVINDDDENDLDEDEIKAMRMAFRQSRMEIFKEKKGYTEDEVIKNDDESDVDEDEIKAIRMALRNSSIDVLEEEEGYTEDKAINNANENDDDEAMRLSLRLSQLRREKSARMRKAIADIEREELEELEEILRLSSLGFYSNDVDSI